jgi:hypothetical protein
VASPSYDTVYTIAEDQMGYLTAAQAAAAGVLPQTLVMMAKRGTLERMSRGVYRLAHFPAHPLAQYMQATLWPSGRVGKGDDGVRGVLSHETALALHGLSDVAPPKVHITVPAAYRIQREVPSYLVLHRIDLPSTQVTALEGLPIVTPERAIRDGIEAQLGPALMTQAIDEGLKSGTLTRFVADQLRAELAVAGFGTEGPPRPTISTPPPPSVGKLDKYVLAYALAEGLAVGRVRHWISCMMLSGALDQAASRPDGPRFVVKGGVALELRMPGRARATEDLDIVVVCEQPDLVEAFDSALRAGYGDCTFTRRSTVHPLGDLGVRVWVQVAYRTQRWATVQVDLAHPDAVDTETERLGGIPLTRFGLQGPSDVPCLSLRYHIAQKWHGMTRATPSGAPNDRFRDAVDLLLLRDLVAPDELSAVRDACEETFRVRDDHPWPPPIALPAHWAGPFAAMAEGLGLPTTTLAEAEGELRGFLESIEAA